ncbi:hypothetical protein [Salinigranum salinum]|uniref:hypothetical protein n=1 Tax=Salinigranum salinum TaxID=1364937 RepID=UPI001260F211|nr:hypothetical protein [Salinigranum salinum]
MPSTVVRWRFSPAATRSLRLLVYAAVGLLVGPAVGFVGLLLTTLLRADAGLLLLVVALFVGLGVGSGRALVGLASGELPTPIHEDVRALSCRWVAGAVLTTAGLTVWGFRATGVGLELIVGSVVTGVLALVIGAGLRTDGVVDCDGGTLTYRGHTVPLDAVRRVRSARVGPFVLALLRYYDASVGPSTPRFVVCSAAARRAIASVRSSDSATTAPGAEDHATPIAVRLVAAAFGLGCLAVGPLLWVGLPAGGGRLLAVYLGLFGLLFGALFIRYALVA